MLGARTKKRITSMSPETMREKIASINRAIRKINKLFEENGMDKAYFPQEVPEDIEVITDYDFYITNPHRRVYTFCFTYNDMRQGVIHNYKTLFAKSDDEVYNILLPMAFEDYGYWYEKDLMDMYGDYDENKDKIKDGYDHLNAVARLCDKLCA